MTVLSPRLRGVERGTGGSGWVSGVVTGWNFCIPPSVGCAVKSCPLKVVRNVTVGSARPVAKSSSRTRQRGARDVALRSVPISSRPTAATVAMSINLPSQRFCAWGVTRGRSSRPCCFRNSGEPRGCWSGSPIWSGDGTQPSCSSWLPTSSCPSPITPGKRCFGRTIPPPFWLSHGPSGCTVPGSPGPWSRNAGPKPRPGCTPRNAGKISRGSSLSARERFLRERPCCWPTMC